jgi:hypothetical protein
MKACIWRREHACYISIAPHHRIETPQTGTEDSRDGFASRWSKLRGIGLCEPPAVIGSAECETSNADSFRIVGHEVMKEVKNDWYPIHTIIAYEVKTVALRADVEISDTAAVFGN